MVADLFECDIDSIIGKDDSHFFSFEHNRQLKNNDYKVLVEGLEIESEEKNVVKSSQEERYYWTVKKPLYQKGQIVGMYGISTDITDRKLLEQQLQEKQALLDCVLNNIDAHIYMKDPNYRFLYVNESVANLFGQPAEALIGKTASECLGKGGHENFNELDDKVFKLGEKVSGQEELTNEQGETRHYLTTKVPIKDALGQVTSYVGMSNDTTEIIELKRKYQKLASIDELTQLANRRNFILQAESELSRFSRHQQPFVLLILDVDHFKQINDHYGHLVGDQALVAIADSLRGSVRECDFVSRIGGEEFAILLPQTSLHEGVALAERIRKKIPLLTIKGKFDQLNALSLSIGVSEVRMNDDGIDTLVARADKALYEAKHNGRNCVESI